MKKIDLSERKVDTREKNLSKVIIYDLEEALSIFNESILTIKSNLSIGLELEGQERIDSAKDIYRSQIVFLESAFDYFCHLIIKYGLKSMYIGDWGKTEQYKNFLVPLYIVEIGMDSPDCSWFVEHVNERLSTLTFLDFDVMKKYFNLINVDLIPEVSKRIYYDRESKQQPHEKLKNFINNLYKRRNLIAHQDDREHEDGIKKDITIHDVNSYISELERFVSEIIKFLKEV